MITSSVSFSLIYKMVISDLDSSLVFEPLDRSTRTFLYIDLEMSSGIRLGGECSLQPGQI